jgi:hypothetical protein
MFFGFFLSSDGSGKSWELFPEANPCFSACARTLTRGACWTSSSWSSRAAVWKCVYKPFYLSRQTVLPIKSNRSTYRVKPFYLSRQTVLPIKSNRSTFQVKPFYLSTSTCTATPRLRERRRQPGVPVLPAQRHARRVGRVVALISRGVSDWLHVRPELDLWVALISRGVSDWLHVRPELDLWVALTPGGCQIGLYVDRTGCRRRVCFDCKIT